MVAGEDLPILLQQTPRSLSEASATVLRGLLDPSLAGESVFCMAAGRATKTFSEQSGAYLDNCQVVPLQHLDFPAGEKSAASLLELSKGLIGKVGLEQA